MHMGKHEYGVHRVGKINFCSLNTVFLYFKEVKPIFSVYMYESN